MYEDVKLSELFVDDVVLSNGQTIREFVMERGIFGHIRTVGNLNTTLLSCGLKKLSDGEIEKARKPRLIDANVLEKRLKEEEVAMTVVSKADYRQVAEVEHRVMERARRIASYAPVAYDKERVLSKIASLYPKSESDGYEKVCRILDRCIEIVKKGGI